jgi:Ca-activated chloride channel family protein
MINRSAQPKQAWSRIRVSLVVSIVLTSLLLTGRSGAALRQDDDAVRVNSDLVVLNVTVTDKSGAYMHGLKQTDFKGFEDGQEQIITGFGEEETPFAAALLLDISGSMDGRMSLARSAAIRFLDGLRTDDSIAVYSFHTEVKKVQDYEYTRDLDPRVFGLSADGLTVLNDAVLSAARDLSTRPEKRRAIVVLSDGADTHSSASADKALNAALNANATLYTVDLSDRNTRTVDAMSGSGALKSFATRSGGRYLPTPGGQELRDAFATVVEELSNQYTITYRPKNHARDGRWRAIEVKLAPQGTVARTRRGYHAPKG